MMLYLALFRNSIYVNTATHFTGHTLYLVITQHQALLFLDQVQKYRSFEAPQVRPDRDSNS